MNTKIDGDVKVGYIKSNNSKVPMAILSCFLIAFILQGILKLSGIFIFEKALTWDIFKIIDSNTTAYVIYHSLINIIAVYTISFSFTKKWYSKNWLHYLIIFGGTIGITIMRTLLTYTIEVQFLYDVILYICIPSIISLTARENRVFNKLNLEAIIITITFEILLYLCFLGLSYWSVLLNSLLPVIQLAPYSSVHFLIFFEVYIGLIMIMLSLNMVIQKINLKE